MKYTWEQQDIQIGRALVHKGGVPFILGWSLPAEADSPFLLISLVDGVTFGPKSMGDLLETLNSDDFRPLESLHGPVRIADNLDTTLKRVFTETDLIRNNLKENK